MFVFYFLRYNGEGQQHFLSAKILKFWVIALYVFLFVCLFLNPKQILEIYSLFLEMTSALPKMHNIIGFLLKH